MHMPSHIDMWVGQYDEAIEVNKKAIVTDMSRIHIGEGAKI